LLTRVSLRCSRNAPDKMTAEFHIPSRVSVDRRGRITAYRIVWIQPAHNADFCEWSRQSMRIRPVLSNLTDTRPRNRIGERDRNESPSAVAVHKSKVTSGQEDSRSNTGLASGVELSGSAASVTRESRRLRGCESCTHFSRPHLPGAIGRSMNCHVTARLVLRTNLLRCRRTEARNAARGS
jgi:hypothetical protein